MSLAEISYGAGQMRFENRRRTEPVHLARHLDAAHGLFHAASEHQSTNTTTPETNADFETLRWFPYATDIRSE